MTTTSFNERSPRTRRHGPGRAPLALAIAAAVAAAACGAPPAPTAATTVEAVPLALTTAERLRMARETVATGTVLPRARVSPGSKIMGRVARVTVQEGDRVRPGQPLVTLEKADLEAAMRQAEAAVAMAEAQLENARAQERRFRVLHERGSVTTRNLEDAVAAFRVAEAGVEQARASLASARVMLGYAEIRAPFGGHVVEKQVEAGDMTRPGVPLLTIDDLSSVKIALDVPESDVVGLEPGGAVTIRIDALGLSVDGTIARIVPAAAAGSRTFTVETVLENTDGRMRSGMFASGRFPRGEESVLLVPEGAVVRSGQLDALFLVGDDGIARLGWIRLGRRRDGGIEVLSGLDAGQRYVLEPPPGLVDGTPVEAR